MPIAWTTPDQLSNSMSEDAEYAIEVASWILYKLTAEKYPGIRTATEWYGSNSDRCWCGGIDIDAPHRHVPVSLDNQRMLALRHTPIRSVESISIDGQTLSPGAYRIENARYLSRRDGRAWNTYTGVEVSYTYGQNPPLAGQRAAALLADQLVLSFCGSDECKLPDRITSVSRQGVSFAVLDPQDFLDKGRTGIFEIDLFIHAANPAGAKQKPKIYSPDRPRRSVR